MYQPLLQPGQAELIRVMYNRGPHHERCLASVSLAILGVVMKSEEDANGLTSTDLKSILV